MKGVKAKSFSPGEELMKNKPISKEEPLNEEELFKVVEAASSVFWLKEAEGFKDRLKELLRAHRPVKNDMVVEDRVKWFAYVIRLVLNCPSFLEKPSGFEWVMEDFQRILALRKISPDYERDFWRAIDHVRAILRPASRPARKDKDYFRCMMIYHMVKNEGLSMTKAVEKLAEDEALFIRKKSKADPVDQVENKAREIRLSLKRIEKSQQEINEILKQWGLGFDRQVKKKRVET